MNVKNYLLKIFVKIFKKNNFLSSVFNEENILIVSTTALGDSLWATPAIKALKKEKPQASIYVLTSTIGQAALFKNPHIKSCFVMKSLLSLLPLFFKLRKMSWNSIVIFHASQRAVLPFCALLGANKLIGSKGMHKGLDSLLTHSIESKYQHEIIRRLSLIQALNVKTDSYNLEYYIGNEERETAILWLKQNAASLSKKIVGIHTGAADKFKQWPESHFIKVAKQLTKEGCHVIFTGGEKERDSLLSLQTQVPFSSCTFPSLPLPVFAALIEKMDLFITNDTGPLHLAIAMKVPTLSLFVPTDASLCGPLNVKNAFVIQKSVTCLPCIKKKCANPFCLRQISVDEVLEKAKKLLI